MTSYAVLLRGVNVGGQRKVPATVLRQIGADAGFTDPITLLNSGNLVVGPARPGTPASACNTAADVAALVRMELAKRLDLEVDVIVATGADLARAETQNPFPDAARERPSTLIVTFYDQAPDPVRVTAIDLSGFPEQMVWSGAVAYTDFPSGVGNSKLTSAFLRRAVGLDGTGRNWNTLGKLRALVDARDGAV